jgi:hypothetical protein
MPQVEGFIKAYDHFTMENAHPIATDSIWFSMFCHRLSSHVPIVNRMDDAMAANGRLTPAHDWLFELQEQSFGSLLSFLDASLVGAETPDRARFCLVACVRVQEAYRDVTAS